MFSAYLYITRTSNRFIFFLSLFLFPLFYVDFYKFHLASQSLQSGLLYGHFKIEPELGALRLAFQSYVSTLLLQQLLLLLLHFYFFKLSISINFLNTYSDAIAIYNITHCLKLCDSHFQNFNRF